VSETTTHAPGTFCWHELGTRDVAGAKQFYTEVLGWTYQDVPMGEMGTYTLIQIDGQDIAGMYEMKGPHFEGIPPHYLSYVATADVDASAAKAKEHGGEVMQPPMDVPGVGRMAVLKDPRGAVFALFQAGEHPGAAMVPDAMGTVCWNELVTDDVAAAGGFYADLFGWGRNESDMGGTSYTMFAQGESMVAGLFGRTPEMAEANVPPHWMPYFTVADIRSAVKKAEELGAAVVVPPTEVPGVGTFSTIQDPTGAHVSIIQLLPRG
jgi:predicted enzyme related to lactoylglutathione lyase